MRSEKWNFFVLEKSKKFESLKSLGSLGGFVCFLWKRKESYELKCGDESANFVGI